MSNPSSTPMDVQFSSMSSSSNLHPLPHSAVHGPSSVNDVSMHSNNPPMTAASDIAASSQSTASSRKRMRPSQWDGSTMTPEFGQNVAIPSSLLNAPYDAAHVPPANLPDTMHIHTCLENIQTALKSLHAMQFAMPSSTSTPSNSFTPTTSSAASAAAAAYVPPPTDYSPDGQQLDHSGSDPESSPPNLSSSSRLPSSRSSPESFRKSKQRLFEKHRRDELKKQMELLSSLINFSNPTNKIGVVMAAISYVREQQTALEREQNRVKNLEAALAESQNKLREFPVPQRTHGVTSLCDVSLSSALSASPTFLMTKYQTLLKQFQEMQFNYVQLAKSQSQLPSCSTAAAFPRVMESKDENIPPTIQNNLIDSSYPFSPLDYNAASAFNPHSDFPENDTPTPLSRPITSSVPDTPVACNQIPLSDPSQLLTSGDSPFTTSLLFKSETTARLLTRDGIIMEISPKMLRDLGFERHELIGKPLTDITPSIKQPMTRLVSVTEEHEAEPLAILDSFKTKQGGIIFLSGLLEIVWDEAKCPGKSGQSHCSAGSGTTATTQQQQQQQQQEPMAYSSTAAGACEQSEDSMEAISVNPGFCDTSNQNVNHFQFHPCGACGQRPRFGVFTGLPTYHTDMEEHITMSIKNVVRLFDPKIQREGLQIDEFFTRGKVSYEATQNPSGAGSTRTMRITKFLPMPFVQACSVYLNMARTAFATKSNPPRIQL